MIRHVALRHIRIAKDGKVTEYIPGDVIPDFKNWNYPAQRANLDMDYVRAEEYHPAPEETEVPSEEDEFLCELCEKGFKSASALKGHVTKKHS